MGLSRTRLANSDCSGSHDFGTISVLFGSMTWSTAVRGKILTFAFGGGPVVFGTQANKRLRERTS